MKKFRLSPDDRWFAGICGGIAEYTGIDSFLIRIAFLTATFTIDIPFGVIYCLIWLLMTNKKKEQ